MKRKLSILILLCGLGIGVSGCIPLDWLRTPPQQESTFFGNKSNKGKPRGEIIGNTVKKVAGYLPTPFDVGAKLLALLFLGISRKP